MKKKILAFGVALSVMLGTAGCSTAHTGSRKDQATGKAGLDRPGVRRSDHGGISHGINHAVNICALGFMGAWDHLCIAFRSIS